MSPCTFKFTKVWFDHKFVKVGSHRAPSPGSDPDGTIEYTDYKCECGAEYSEEVLYSWQPNTVKGL